MEVEGANPEVDQCFWSTQKAQFAWDLSIDKPGQLRNQLSGQCLATADGVEVYAGPLSGKRHTALLLNRGTSTANITVDFASLADEHGRQMVHDGARMKVRDILLKKDAGVFRGAYAQEVPPHAVAHLVLEPATTTK